jgi:electron transfer flavoprotein beta subunit
MRIIVLAKQVPDIEKNVKVSIDEKTQSIKREGIPSIMNPSDKNALEEALKLKDSLDAEVIVVSMGPMQANEILKEAISMGASSCYLVTDKAFAGSDTLATSLILYEAIKKIGSFDFIFAGKQAIDGDTGQVGPGVAVRFGIPHILNAKIIEYIDCNRFLVKREFLGFEEIIEVSPPALIIFPKNINIPRLPSLRGLFKMKEYESSLITNNILGIDKDKVGINGSPTKVIRTFKPIMDKSYSKIDLESGEEIVNLILSKIKEVK